MRLPLLRRLLPPASWCCRKRSLENALVGQTMLSKGEAKRPMINHPQSPRKKGTAKMATTTEALISGLQIVPLLLRPKHRKPGNPRHWDAEQGGSHPWGHKKFPVDPSRGKVSRCRLIRLHRNNCLGLRGV